MQRESSKARRQHIELEVAGAGTKLHAGGGRRHQLQLAMGAASPSLEGLMYMAPKNTAYRGVAIDDGEELRGVDEPDGIQPVAAERHRVVMQHDEHMPNRSACECGIEALKFAIGESAFDGARQ